MRVRTTRGFSTSAFRYSGTRELWLISSTNGTLSLVIMNARAGNISPDRVPFATLSLLTQCEFHGPEGMRGEITSHSTNFWREKRERVDDPSWRMTYHVSQRIYLGSGHAVGSAGTSASPSRKQQPATINIAAWMHVNERCAGHKATYVRECTHVCSRHDDVFSSGVSD